MGEAWIDGHVVFPTQGFCCRKPLAVVVNARFAGAVVPNSFFADGSSCGLSLTIDGKPYWVATAHLDAYNSVTDYTESLRQTRAVLDHAPA